MTKKRKRRLIGVIVGIGFYAGVFMVGYMTQVPLFATIDEEFVENMPYESYFKKYAVELDWDWRLLAAVCYQESRFRPNAVSHRGAKGLMQLMPSTAESLGLDEHVIFDPEQNIRAGAMYLSRLKEKFSFIGNREENTKFVLASYNAGVAHVMDARRLAKRYGRSPYVWEENTAYWMEQLSNPEYANDSVVLYGAFDASEPIHYVKKVLKVYHQMVKDEEQNVHSQREITE